MVVLTRRVHVPEMDSSAVVPTEYVTGETFSPGCTSSSTWVRKYMIQSAYKRGTLSARQRNAITCADPEGGGGGRGSGPSMKNHKNIGFLSNSGPNSLKNHSATEPAFNVGPSSARQRNVVSLAGR